MANKDYKNGKLIEIVREFNHTGATRYEINGINQAIAIPFWRIAEGKFKVIPKGSYRITSEAGNNYIEITDNTILKQATQFQLCYIYTQNSSKYIEEFPELSVMVDKYNELVDDATKLFSYLKSVGMVSDTLQLTKVLTQLEPLTTWYMDEQGEIKALPISELYNKFQQMIDTLYKIIKDQLDKDYANYTQELRTLTDKLLKELRDLRDKCTDAIQKKGDEQLKRLEVAIQNVADQQFNYTLPANQKVINLPSTWIVSNFRDKVYIDGILMPPNEYTIANRQVTLKRSYPYPADVFVSSILPITYVEEQIKIFYDNIERKTNEFNTNANNKTTEFNNNSTEKTNTFNKNATDKTTAFDLNAKNKTASFDKNASDKTSEFNKNAGQKTDNFNSSVAGAIESVTSAGKAATSKAITEINTHTKDVVKPAIDVYIEKTVKPDINNHVETVSKPEIKKYVESQKQEINDTLFPELLSSMLGKTFKGKYNPNDVYFPGDIYKKSFSDIVAFTIPSTNAPLLTKESSQVDINGYYRVYDDIERPFDFVSNKDERVIGIAIESSGKVIRTNSCIEFELNRINYTVAFDIPTTDTPVITKIMTAEQNDSSVAITKKQTDKPLWGHFSQSNPTLKKYSY